MKLSLLGRVSLVMIASVVPFPAQINTGQIAGKVFDSTGAVVPGVSVTATNEGTGLAQSISTDANGNYSFPSLARGNYSVRSTKEGFRSAERSGVVVEAASRLGLDFTLEVGQVSEAVSVVAQAQQVQTSSGDLSTVVTERQLSQIALNGRNYTQLLRLIPGSATTGNLDAFGLGLSTTSQRVNGIRTNSLYFMVDGADNMDNGGNSNAIITPNVDTISEVRVLTSSYAAEFGGRSGGMVNVVTKSGTREFHGSAFEFVRNDVFDARSFFAQSKPPLRFNNFGWTLGGPVFWPGKFNSDRQKLFFFGGQEWKFNRQSTVQTSNVPTAAERQGDFRDSTLPAPQDPLTRQPFPDRIVPPSRWSRNGPALLKPYPLPNFAGPGGNYVATAANRTDTTENMIKLDYLPSANQQFMYRFTHQDWDIFNGFQGSSTGIVPGGRPRPGWTTVLSHSYTVNPTTINYISLSVSANQIQGLPANDILRRDALGLSYPEIFAANNYQVGPSLNVAGFTGYNVGDRIRNLNTTFQLRDDFSKVVGSHTLKFGAHYTRSRKDQNNSGANDNGTVTFNTSAAGSSRNVIADVLLGNFQNYTEGQVDTSWFARYDQFELYAQDSWRVSRKLTVELGLRYNLVFPLYSALGNFTTFDPARFRPEAAPSVNPGNGALDTPGDPWNGLVIFGDSFPDRARGRIPAVELPGVERLFTGLPRGGTNTEYGNFGPRLSFAFDPLANGRTALRGGFGIFYDRIQTDFLGGSSNNPPFASSANIFEGNIDNPGGGTQRDFPANVSGIFLGMRTPRVYSFNLGVQQELRSGLIAEVGYVGTMGRNLLRTININQPRPGTAQANRGVNLNSLRPYQGYATINLQDTGDSSNYNSLQASLNQRYRAGLNFGLTYTWSRTLDTSGGTFQDIYNPRADYGLSSIHRAHILTVNWVYELPFFRSGGPRLVRAALGGWEISGISLFQSGAPNSVTVPEDVAGIGGTSSRADVVGDPVLASGERTLSRWFNTEAFLPASQMTPGRFGNSGRNVLIGPSYTQTDVALMKNFSLGEQFRLQFRGESFNVLNHPSFTGINTTVRFDNQGRPAQNYGAVTSSGPGRVLSFGLKLLF
ncbi:MAG TPA: TonB-dependent receptor [Bryobacteraceae bacterium]|nr:TonB-dependent receptor [Bryobacteraceae bacterium]